MALLDVLTERVGLGQRELLRRVFSAPLRYKVYQIPKRTGGHRTIAQPARDVKLLGACSLTQRSRCCRP